MVNIVVVAVKNLNGRTNMPPKDSLILCGCLLDTATHKNFEEICKDMGVTTQEVITAFIYSVINGDVKNDTK